MKDFTEYNKSSNDTMKRSGIKIFNKQLQGLESQDIIIDGINEKGIILNHLNDMNIDVEDRGLNVSLDSSLRYGSYVEVPSLNKMFLAISDVDYHYFYKNCRIRWCNQTINRINWDSPVYCYATNSSYGDKGVIQSDTLNEIDGKILFYMQDNKKTSEINLDERYIFDNDKRQVYKVVKTETVTNGGTGHVRKIVMAKSEANYEKDDFDNNIAYNGIVKDTEHKDLDTSNQFNIISTNGNMNIKKYNTNTFKIVDSNNKETNDKWDIKLNYNGNSIDYIVVVKQNDNSISIKNLLGYSDNKLELEFTNKSDNSIVLRSDIGLILK